MLKHIPFTDFSWIVRKLCVKSSKMQSFNSREMMNWRERFVYIFSCAQTVAFVEFQCFECALPVLIAGYFSTNQSSLGLFLLVFPSQQEKWQPTRELGERWLLCVFLEHNSHKVYLWPLDSFCCVDTTSWRGEKNGFQLCRFSSLDSDGKNSSSVVLLHEARIICQHAIGSSFSIPHMTLFVCNLAVVLSS